MNEEFFYSEEDAMSTAIRKIMVASTAWALVVTAGMCAAASQLKQRPDEAQYEQKLAQEVRHQLVLLPFYSVFDNLEFSAKDGTVTLIGQVVGPALKSNAEAAVKHIEGVAQVVNNIEILPVAPSDDRLRRALYHKIYGDTALPRYALQAVPPIHIIVKNGHVTLVGVVAIEMDKNVAGMRANAVSGVFSVENQLQVESKKGGA